MRCPKCGSEIKKIILNVGSIQECVKCNILDIKQYQFRLDKVLSKFECKYPNNAPYIKLTLHIHIVYCFGSFHLSNNCADEYIEIQLDTVELLLRDLGNK